MSLTHSDLVAIAVGWLFRGSGSHGKCPVVISEMSSEAQEQPDAIGFKSGHSILVECKASRSDFKSDHAKSFRKYPISAMGNWRYYMAPTGIIKPDELPPMWGLIEVEGDPSQCRTVVPASFRKDSDRRFEILLLTSALRRQVCDSTKHGVKVSHYVIDSGKLPRRAGIMADSSAEAQEIN